MSVLADVAGEKKSLAFEVHEPLIDGRVAFGCRACVVLPARNEEERLSACLDAFKLQQDTQGKALPAFSFEILLLLNNCTDASVTVAHRWKAAHPEVALHVIVRELPAAEAHAGTARRLLMDTAWHRLQRLGRNCAILSSDADSTVAPDWIAQNLHALEAGADAVGGVICLRPQDLAELPAQVRHCYWRDRRYAELVARLEDLLDPQAGDRWPRHLDHFGSSLACTPEAYAHAGGMPAAATLEDEAFVDRLRRANQTLRHEPAVRVMTSARLDGRASVGLAGQLRMWSELPDEHAQVVQSAEFLAHRFRILRWLREVFALRCCLNLSHLSMEWQRRLRDASEGVRSFPQFLLRMDCNAFVAEAFMGDREEPIAEAIRSLERMQRELSAKLGRG